ncbi:NAD(P)H-hydrate dehydratase [Oceanicella actignis]|uniref:Bifunctional NAD(P)H-hydrate repair enzyme n=1 Tax=Oceanicella actignis TaxID=1189325 RepID=A0A1M7RTX5_9RHOB|nr:yjeF C-terminal region, hydroxyethylthiazole kinase-related/yjeF N-terminal region [Oceanicella actignis]SHN49691.1 yjeF C-terminal region, hydroxyethylthiazole kinase-related/yjeF N-terminal region [Oceanicella actignis]
MTNEAGAESAMGGGAWGAFDGPTVELLDGARMRALEQAQMAAGRISGLELMEAAGAAIVAALSSARPELARRGGRAAVLCGPGANGGDGFVAARRLAGRGWAVEVFMLGDPARQPPDAAANRRRWEGLGPVRDIARAADAAPGAFDAVIDAGFGTGLSRPIPRTLRAALDAASRGAFVVAADMPSGWCADSGRHLGEGPAPARGADLTVTFHRPRLGHALGDGPRAVGRLVVADIGLPQDPIADAPLLFLGPPRGLDKAAAGPRAHKYVHGHALVLAGGCGKGGAARLAARAALRVGAGLVTVAPPPEALAENAARLDAVMLRPVADAEALRRALADRRINALALGMGLGADARARALTLAALESGRAATLDADALGAFAADPAPLFAALRPDCVLTPHEGEFARLFPDLAERLRAPALAGPAFSRLDAAREAARRAGATVLLKGPDTVIASPDGAALVHLAAGPRAAPWLATAGAGDVLAGLIAGLAARGFAPLEAAAAAAWLHVEAALRVGPGLIAEDLPEALPAVLRALPPAGAARAPWPWGG